MARCAYPHPLCLVFVPATQQLPTPREAEVIYDERVSVEHSIRFMKTELGMTCVQFNGGEIVGESRQSRRYG
jgi:hypothetical protein